MKLLREYILISSQNSILSDRRYITEVLCVEIPLHESYPFSHEVQSKILYEHMLLEGFWSDVKEMAGTTKQLFSTFKEVTTDPKRLASFSSIIGKTAKYPVKQMYKLLDTIIDTLTKHEDKFPTFISWAKKLKDFIKKLVGKVYGVDGWKGALVKTSFALAIKYLWDNVGEMVTAVNDGFKSLLTKLKDDLTGDKLDELMDKVKDFLKEKLSPVIDWVKEKFMSLAGKLVTQFSGIGAWFDWAKTAFEGAKFVLGFLTNPLKKFDGIKGFKAEGVLREHIRELLSERSTFKRKGSSEYFRVDLPGIGYAEGSQNLRFKECQSDVDAIMKTPEYLAAEKKYQESAKPRTDIVRNEETGKYEEVEVGPAKFKPRFYDVTNAWISNPENRGKGHGKEIYKAFIDQAAEYSKSYGGVFVGAHRCVMGSGSSENAQRVWKSLGREYTSSGMVIFIGL